LKSLRFSQVRGVSRSTISETAPLADLARLLSRQVRLTKPHLWNGLVISAEGAGTLCRLASADTFTPNVCVQTSESAFELEGNRSRSDSSDGCLEWNAHIAETNKAIAIRVCP
jgi:hypothetical protein